MRGIQPVVAIVAATLFLACAAEQNSSDPDSMAQGAMGAVSEEEVADYIEKYSYQETYRMLDLYVGGDPAMLNVWVLGGTPALVKAGEDKVVRMNNDTYYKLAFMDLSSGPVILRSTAPSMDRFSSFQLMDDRNVNFRNLIHPDGTFTLYYGSTPGDLEGEGVESPSESAVVIVRVEVKNVRDDADVGAAETVFNGITIEGPEATEVPQLDLLSAFSEEVAGEAMRRIDDTIETSEFRQLAAGPGQVPDHVSLLQLAAGGKSGWGAPDTSHSSYETIFADLSGEPMQGANGTYAVTSEAPEVDAFWSVTVYDTERGGYFHPNDEDRYHINNTTAVENDDGTVTFLFKQQCGSEDVNCLEVPPGQFDMTMRYYLPSDAIQSGEWTFAKLELID